MADLQKTVEIVFGAKSAELEKALGTIESKLTSFSSGINDISAPFAGVADNILKLDAVLAALVAGGMALAIKESSEFNSSFAQISTSVSATGDDLKKFREDIITYSSGSVKSLSDINSAIYTAAQAGIDYGESLDFMAKAEQLAVANKSDLNTTVDLLTSTMAAYGMSVKDLTRINDVYFSSTLIGKQTIEELGGAMGQVVGIAAISGVSFEELSAAIATLTAKGMTTENAITAVKSVIMGIISPSEEAAKAASALGLSFNAGAIDANSFQGMMKLIMEKTGGSKQAMVELFPEVRAMNGAFQLTGDGMAFFNKALDLSINSAGMAEEAYKKMVGTFENQSQLLINNAKLFMVEVGTKLEESAGPVMASLGSVFSGLSSSIRDGAFDPLFDYISRLGKELADKLKVIAQNLPEAMKGLDFSNLIASFGGLGDALKTAFQTVFGQIDLTTVEGLHEVLQRVIDDFTGLINVTKSIIEGMRPLFEVIGALIDGFENTDAAMQEMIGNVLGLGKALYELTSHTDLIKSLLAIFTGSAIVNIVSGFQAMSGAITLTLIPAMEKFAAASMTLLLSPAGLVAMGAALAAFTGYALYNVSATNKMADSLHAQANAQNRATLSMIEGKIATGDITRETALAAIRALELNSNLDVSAVKAKAMTLASKDMAPALQTAARAVTEFSKEILEVPDKNEVRIGVQADGSSIEKAHGMIIQYFPDGSTRITNVAVEADKESMDKTKKDIEKEIPAEKLLEIKSNVDIARLKEQSAIIQSSIEWKAKIDIAQIESATEKMKVMFQSVDKAIESTADVMIGLAGAMNGIDSSRQLDLIDIIREESDRREGLLELQKELIEAETDSIRARTKLMEEGKEIGIKISAEGLAPHLEAFMFEILNAIQVRAVAEGVQMLV